MRQIDFPTECARPRAQQRSVEEWLRHHYQEHAQTLGWLRPGMGALRAPCNVVLSLGLALALTACKQKGPASQLESTQALAAVLAEEAAKAAGLTKQVLVISPGGVWGTPAPLEQAFTTALSKRGVSITATRSVDVGDPMRSGHIGLKRADFLSALDQAADAGVIVSFAGPPALGPGEAIKAQHPPVLVVATAMLGATAGLPGDRSQLVQLLESKIIQLAVVDATEQAPSPPDKGDAAHELFAQHYRILRAPE